MSAGKKYGLTVPNKKSEPVPAGTLKPRLSCFDEESDESEPESKKVGQAILRASEKSVQKRATQKQLKRAIEEDPTVFQYDEVYDDMEQKKAETVAKKKDVSKKPKYIENLLKTAEKRKMENERRIERQVQREREEEGEQFKDKEEFVTSAYRAKLEEFRLQEAQEKMEDALEAKLDASKQNDLSSFYKRLYKEKFKDPEIKTEPVDEDEAEQSQSPVKEKSTEKKKERKYRSRKDSSGASESENEGEPSKTEGDSKTAGDSDTSKGGSSSGSSSSDSSGSSSESENEEEKSEKPKNEEPKADEKKPDTVKEKNKDIELEDEPKEPPKPKINIWEKRTVGAVFDAALLRYFERKAARED